jgi:hypothetical protein
MNKLIPFNKFANKKKVEMVSDTSVVVDEKGTPMGFVFGRDAFISFLEHIDEEFENKITNQKKAFNNPAGKLIDLIEENLPVNPTFIKDMKKSTVQSKQTEWIPFDKVIQALHV